MTEYTKTIVSALSSRNSDYSDPHVLLREATQTGANEVTRRIDGRLEANTTDGTSTIYKGADYYNLSLMALGTIDSFIFHNRSDVELALTVFAFLGEFTTDTNPGDIAVTSSHITSSVSQAFYRGVYTPGAATHALTYSANASNNNDFTEISSIGTSNTRITSTGTPWGTAETDADMKVQLFQKQLHYVPAGKILMLPNIRKIKTDIAQPEVTVAHGFSSDAGITPVTTAADYTIFMTGTNS
tara:strand:+ start:14274 stop:14999 length:726 start_codon:yes stop_codon:yes gene_type:complete